MPLQVYATVCCCFLRWRQLSVIINWHPCLQSHQRWKGLNRQENWISFTLWGNLHITGTRHIDEVHHTVAFSLCSTSSLRIKISAPTSTAIQVLFKNVYLLWLRPIKLIFRSNIWACPKNLLLLLLKTTSHLFERLSRLSDIKGSKTLLFSWNKLKDWNIFSDTF